MKHTKPITFKSRYGDLRTIRDNGGGSITVSGKSNFMRGGEGMVDFEGGPIFFVGETVGYAPFENRIVEEIIWEQSANEGEAKVTLILKDE